MAALTHFRQLFQHMAWADDQVRQLLNHSPAARHPSILRLFSYLLASERVWLLRLREENSALQPIWPELTFEEISYHRGQIAAAVRASGGDPVNTDYIRFVREVA